MSFASNRAHRLGNTLYKRAFPIYRPLYRAYKAYSDRGERKLLANQLTPGCVVVDAGANIGIYSQFLAQCVGLAGVVHSFEPEPTNFARLHQALSHLPNVRLNKVAIGDTTGEGMLYISDALNVDHRAYPTGEYIRQTTPIRAVKLDDYFRPGERVDLIKLDIQGYELHALRGAERLLQERAELKLLLECWPYGLALAGGSTTQLHGFLRQRGFEVYQFHNGVFSDFTAADDANEQVYFNLFAERSKSQ
ncbi:MAG: FkbM family methyltransferase [Verrucomicrobia bacterium]|nr:MAG: FkbM family methyltransferase [Verrucomicrobiota bacterium]